MIRIDYYTGNRKKVSMSILLCLLLLNTGCYLSFSINHDAGELISGKVVKVLDGDTYDLLLEDMTTVRVRMDGIDAPESGMPFSNKAKQYLGELCKNQTVRISSDNKDRYGRIVSFSYLEDGRELSREMLKAGYAWHYKQYNKDRELAELEKEARAAKRGLWQDKNPMATWEVRKLRRKGISTKNMFETTEK
jgi:endonuclease YncB( thermonuclease family)